MIAITPYGKNFPLEVLAKTDKGDTAYFVDSRILKPVDETSGQEGSSPSGSEWYPYIDCGHRLTIFIAGNPGAGKSYLSAELINRIPTRRAGEQKDVLLFTALQEPDGNFRSLDKNCKIWQIRMSEDILNSLTLSLIRQRCKYPILLFDDIDKIRDKKVSEAVYKLMEDALANGRGHREHDGVGDVHVIATSHALNDYRKTKYMLENSDYVALFPQSTTLVQMQRMFEKLGLSKEMLEKVRKLGRYDGVRRIIIKKTAPMYLISGSQISLI